MTQDWFERTRKGRILAFGGLALAGAAYFASLGMWTQAAWGAAIALLNLVFLVVPLPGGRPMSAAHDPTADLEKSVRKVEARKDP